VIIVAVRETACCCMYLWTVEFLNYGHTTRPLHVHVRHFVSSHRTLSFACSSPFMWMGWKWITGDGAWIVLVRTLCGAGERVCMHAGLFVNCGSSDGFARHRRVRVHRVGAVVPERTGSAPGMWLSVCSSVSLFSSFSLSVQACLKHFCFSSPESIRLF